MNAPISVTAEFLRGNPLPKHGSDSDKGDRGCALVVGGSVPVPGAALLAGTAALRAGAGVLQIATCRSIAPYLGLALPEALVIGLPETAQGGIAGSAAAELAERSTRAQAILIGPGMVDDEAVATFVPEFLDALDGPALVLDAAALTALGEASASLRRHAGRMVITPHAGEMARFLGVDREAVAADRLDAAQRAAGRCGCIVAMKGACTYIVDPAGEAWSCAHGNVGLATSGSGDTLAGIVLGLLARGAEPLQATQWAVYLHAEAGNRLAHQRGPVGFLAHELLAEIPMVMRDIGGGARAPA
jgi:ADP-dependent NAD(P)H-hydrate dehydratase